MIGVENITDWRGQDVVDRTGDKLGKLEEVYFDGETDEPAFAAVKSGLVSKSLTLVPTGTSISNSVSVSLAHRSMRRRDGRSSRGTPR